MDWITQYCKEDIRYYLCHTDLTVKEVCTKHYLCHTDLTVKEVCTKLGFTNLSFFGSYVRKCFGVSPSALKKRRMAEK